MGKNCAEYLGERKGNLVPTNRYCKHCKGEIKGMGLCKSCYPYPENEIRPDLCKEQAVSYILYNWLIWRFLANGHQRQIKDRIKPCLNKDDVVLTAPDAKINTGKILF